MIKLISFDLQGTISESYYSDYFWLEILPKQYSLKNKASLEKAKEELYEIFKSFGKYDYRYYDDAYWNKVLDFDTKNALKSIKKPKLDDNLLNFVKLSKIPCVILSTTTRLFIDLELGENKKYFTKTFSTLDDFNIAGKPKEAFIALAKTMNVKPCEILHIGDSEEMDIKNARDAGCKAIRYLGEDCILEIQKLLQQENSNLN